MGGPATALDGVGCGVQGALQQARLKRSFDSWIVLAIADYHTSFEAALLIWPVLAGHNKMPHLL